MLAILILALLLRLPLIGQSLWLDESIQALALMGKMGPLLNYALADFQPPLYHLLAYPINSVIGYSEIALRIPSLIYSLLSIYFLFKLSRLLYGNRAAYLAGALLATNPLHIYYSTEARSYMLTTFLMSASYLYFFELIKNKYDNRTKVLYTIFTSLALYSSYTAWVGVLVQIFILASNKYRKHLLLPIISVSTFILWLPSLARQLQIGLSTATSNPLWARVVGAFEFERIPRTWIKFQIGRTSFDNNYIYLLIVIVIFLIHFSVLKLRKPNKNILKILILTPLITAIISLFVPIYQYFRLLYLLPIYVILISYPLSKERFLKKLFFISLNIIFVLYYWLTPSFHKEGWKSASEYINDNWTYSSVLALPSITQNAPLKYYLPDYPSYTLLELEGEPEQIFYFVYVEDLFDYELKGRKLLIESNYTVKEEVSYSGNIHLIVYTIDNENRN